MKIYFLMQVTDDYYNPREFLAAYSTKELAEKAKANHGEPKGVDLEIEEVELDSQWLDEPEKV